MLIAGPRRLLSDAFETFGLVRPPIRASAIVHQPRVVRLVDCHANRVAVAQAPDARSLLDLNDDFIRPAAEPSDHHGCFRDAHLRNDCLVALPLLSIERMTADGPVA